MNALITVVYGVLVYIVFTQAVLGICMAGDPKIREEREERGLAIHIEALVIWPVILFPFNGVLLERGTVIVSFWMWVCFIVWTYLASPVTCWTFVVLTPVVPIVAAVCCFCHFLFGEDKSEYGEEVYS